MINEKGALGPRVLAHSAREFRGADRYNETHEEFQEFGGWVYSRAKGLGRKFYKVLVGAPRGILQTLDATSRLLGTRKDNDLDRERESE